MFYNTFEDFCEEFELGSLERNIYGELILKTNGQYEDYMDDYILCKKIQKYIGKRIHIFSLREETDMAYQILILSDSDDQGILGMLDEYNCLLENCDDYFIIDNFEFFDNDRDCLNYCWDNSN